MIGKLIILFIRLGSGSYMLFQGYEKITGGFAVDGLVPVIKENQDSPYWYKDFFEYVVAPNLELFKWIIPLGEIAIGLALILGVFIMLNYILADMIFTYPTQLFFFIILLMNKETMKTLSLSHFLKRTTGKDWEEWIMY